MDEDGAGLNSADDVDGGIGLRCLDDGGYNTGAWDGGGGLGHPIFKRRWYLGGTPPR